MASFVGSGCVGLRSHSVSTMPLAVGMHMTEDSKWLSWICKLFML